MGFVNLFFGIISIFCFIRVDALYEDEVNFDWYEFKYESSSRVFNDLAHLEQITRRMVEIFEEKHVSGTNLPISDQIISIK